MKEIALIIGTIAVGFYLIFSTGMPASEPHAIKNGGWLIVLVHFAIISISTIFLLKFIGSNVNPKVLIIDGLLWVVFAIISIWFTILALANPQYFPEILIVPICNIIYLTITFKCAEKIINKKNKA